jgi:hypothetical protein
MAIVTKHFHWVRLCSLRTKAIVTKHFHWVRLCLFYSYLFMLVVKLHVFRFLVPWCSVRYDFYAQTMFDSY